MARVKHPFCYHSLLDRFEVMALLIAGAYRRACMYLSRAKDEHVRQFELTTAAAIRGIGPTFQAAELPLNEFLWHPRTGAYSSWCLFPSCLGKLKGSSCWQKMCIDEVQNAVTIKLSASKTDPRTLTTTRTWRCACAGDSLRLFPFWRGQRAKQKLAEVRQRRQQLA